MQKKDLGNKIVPGSEKKKSKKLVIIEETEQRM